MGELSRWWERGVDTWRRHTMESKRSLPEALSQRTRALGLGHHDAFTTGRKISQWRSKKETEMRLLC